METINKVMDCSDIVNNVTELTLPKLKEYVEEMVSQGYSESYIQKSLGVGEVGGGYGPRVFKETTINRKVLEKTLRTFVADKLGVSNNISGNDVKARSEEEEVVDNTILEWSDVLPQTYDERYEKTKEYHDLFVSIVDEYVFGRDLTRVPVILIDTPRCISGTSTFIRALYEMLDNNSTNKVKVIHVERDITDRSLEKQVRGSRISSILFLMDDLYLLRDSVLKSLLACTSKGSKMISFSKKDSILKNGIKKFYHGATCMMDVKANRITRPNEVLYFDANTFIELDSEYIMSTHKLLLSDPKTTLGHMSLAYRTIHEPYEQDNI